MKREAKQMVETEARVPHRLPHSPRKQKGYPCSPRKSAKRAGIREAHVGWMEAGPRRQELTTLK